MWTTHMICLCKAKGAELSLRGCNHEVSVVLVQGSFVLEPKD